MKKRILCSILAILLCFALFGCTNGAKDGKNEEEPLFANVEDFKKHMEAHCWITSFNEDDGMTRVRMFVFEGDKCAEYVIEYDENKNSLEEAFLEMLKKQPGEYEDVYSFLAASNISEIKKNIYTVRYNSMENKITSDEKTWFVYEDYISCVSKLYFISQERSELSHLENAFNNAYVLSRYPGIASYKDVKYDPYSYLGDNFVIAGNAELDDYYNYEYRNFESVYFCIRITPTGGGYTDMWYIYADRDSFSELYNTLKKGSISNITLICNANFYNATKESMATLINYFN